VKASTAQIAKATLHRLVQLRQDPTPENYARAWIEAGGVVGDGTGQADAGGWAQLIEQLAQGLERRGRHWTTARRRDSLQRVLAGSRAGPLNRLQERLTQLCVSWQHDESDAKVETVVGELAPSPQDEASAGSWTVLASRLQTTVSAGLPMDDGHSAQLARALESQARRWQGGTVDEALLRQVQDSCDEVRRVFTQRHLMVDEMTRLVRAMTEGLTELAEDESWARGQADAMRMRLGEGGEALSLRGVRSAADLLSQTRRQQQRLRGERDRARDALRALVDSLAEELKALGMHTGRFGDQLSHCVEGLETADTREQLATLVHDIVTASRTVQTEVADAGARLTAGREQAEALNQRVRELEAELRRLSDEASTDALTQVANRRGLIQAFETEAARHECDAMPLAVALIDIDNFKKLNDSLGHAAGDEALRALAAQVRKTLRPVDHVARFGGEEFVMLLPATAVDEAREVLGRVQRALSMSLFLHEGREVFVTFSGGVTLWRPGETLDSAVERADLALYEAKRTGKNRTCIG